MSYPIEVKKPLGPERGSPYLSVNDSSFNRFTTSYSLNQTVSDQGGDLSKLMDLYDYRVVVGFRVENMTSRPLTDPVVHAKGGAIETPFVEIPPKSSAMFVTRKTRHKATGSYGTVSWTISPHSGLPRRVVIMWSAPFNHDFYDNYLAVGISDNTYDMDWFDTMYSDVSYSERVEHHSIAFHKRDFSSRIEKVRVSDKDISVEGTMGTHHKAQVIVTIHEK